MRATATTIDLKHSARDASLVRREIARLFHAKPAGRIVLAPGMLSALRHLFSAVHVDRLLLTKDEYYAPRHFPALRTESVKVSSLLERIIAARPDAVIVSVVSWQGRPLPVAALFADVRRVLGARAPLLIADYTHAGAIGFPAASELNADVVAGDAEKWLLPPRQSSRLAFLWIRSPQLFRIAARAFAPFFLAVERQGDARSSRWIDPEEMRGVAEWLADARFTRRTLADRHHANLLMKRRLAKELGIDPEGAASVLWTGQRIPARLASRLNRHGLLWRNDAGRTRILCRTDT